jgi:hypothetical protein
MDLEFAAVHAGSCWHTGLGRIHDLKWRARGEAPAAAAPKQALATAILAILRHNTAQPMKARPATAATGPTKPSSTKPWGHPPGAGRDQIGGRRPLLLRDGPAFWASPCSPPVGVWWLGAEGMPLFSEGFGSRMRLGPMRS